VPVKFPGILSDGRLFTDYSPSAVVNDDIRKRNRIATNQDYRTFLVQNTNSLMKTNMNNSMVENRTEMFPVIMHGTPHLFTSVEDNAKPFGYEDSMPKNMFLSRQQLDDKKRRPLHASYD
jgi:hypothetical protein